MHPLKCASSFILKIRRKELGFKLMTSLNEKQCPKSSKDANHLSEISAYWHSHVIIRRGLALGKCCPNLFFLDYLIRNGCPG